MNIEIYIFKRKMKRIISRKNAFTLVELLIVIALIAILSVGVLATINPIEQTNKAKDANVRNDAGETLNAYERYYTTSQTYPWMSQGDAASVSVETSILARSDMMGFGICGVVGVGVTKATYQAAGVCATASSTTGGVLIAGDELKSSFAAKDEFLTVGAKDENGLWVFKESGSGGGIYVCYVPKAKSNRTDLTKLYCLKNDTSTTPPTTTRVLSGETNCLAPAYTNAAWGNPTTAVLPATTVDNAIFLCIP